MEIKQEDNHTLIVAQHDSVVEFASDLTRRHEEFKDNNLILDISSYKNLELEDLLGFLELSNIHREDKKSFVIINNALPIEKIPDELCVVPTLQEAKDVIQMDEIQRELGF
ncbi:MAG TPA: hypothetical protein VLO29_04730 [Salegentibacter sp.]|nr:hypothetical protein [Salegentibacter sp.]